MSMAVISRHRMMEGLLGFASLGVLFAALATFNETFRMQLSGLLSGESNDFVLAGGRLEQLAHTAFGTIQDHATTRTPLVAFATAGVVLLVLMLKR